MHMTSLKIGSGATCRIAFVLAGAFVAMLIPFAAPIGLAHACGCGAYSPEKGGTATVPSETALVRSAGDGSEDVYLSLTLDSDVRSGALLFPVPDRHARVDAGPAGLFDALAALTTPRHTGAGGGEDGNGAAAPAPGVTVENRQQVGPLDVVTLSSGDPAALTEWLQRNGFTAKPALTQAAEPYTSAGWAFVAVRLRPEAADATPLDGRLDPLHLHFASRGVVYPMRLSAMAAEPEQVTVYTLGRQQLAMHTTTDGMHLTYSARIDAAAHSDLAAVLADGTDYLTRLDGVLAPTAIDDDFHFRATDSAATVLPSDGGASVHSTGQHVVDRAALPAGPGSSDDTARTVGIVAGVLGLLGLIGAALVVHNRRRPGHF